LYKRKYPILNNQFPISKNIRDRQPETRIPELALATVNPELVTRISQPVSHNLHRVNRANLPTRVALDAKVGDDFVLFVRLEQDGFNRAFLRTFGTTDAQIVDLVFNQVLAFA
jgi:hypothetical protein